MKLNKRTLTVQEAEVDMMSAILNVAESYDLTNTEILGILLKEATRYHLHTLRLERHGTTSKKADEE